jgi:hypothetical protein
MKKEIEFLKYVEMNLDTYNNNYVMFDSTKKISDFVENNDFESESSKKSKITENFLDNKENDNEDLKGIKEELLKTIKTNENGIEYILRKDFTGIEEKYSEKEKNKSKNLKDKIKEYNLTNEMESFEDFRKDVYVKTFKKIQKEIEKCKEKGLNEKETKEKLFDVANFTIQKEFDTKFFHKESTDKGLQIDFYFKERDKEFNITVDYGKIKELENQENKGSYELNVIELIGSLSITEVMKVKDFISDNSLKKIENFIPKVLKFESDNLKLYDEITEKIYSDFRKDTEKLIANGTDISLDFNNYKTSLLIDGYFGKYDLKVNSFEKEELETNYNEKHKIENMKEYEKGLKANNVIEVKEPKEIKKEKIENLEKEFF